MPPPNTPQGVLIDVINIGPGRKNIAVLLSRLNTDGLFGPIDPQADNANSCRYERLKVMRSGARSNSGPGSDLDHRLQFAFPAGWYRCLELFSLIKVC